MTSQISHPPAPSHPAQPVAQTAPALAFEEGALWRHDERHSVRSGSLHYFRVVPEQWHDRLLRLADLGLNSVDTYVPWNFHQQHEADVPSFTGWRDIGRFIETAGDVGLDVLLRPGPYICAEWSNGGLPSWLTGRVRSLRSSDPGFTGAVAQWFDHLLPRLAPYQSSAGGPVVAFQVENEYGSYGDDPHYIRWLAGLLRTGGIRELLYTADGPTDVMFDGGSLPGTLATVTLGSKPEDARALLQARRTGEPFFVAEFWNGWFDHWGHPHHVREAASAADVASKILEDGGSISLYMAHGGTNFGLWSGANIVDGELRPTVTSYDSDAPISEDGRLTEKFFALRKVFGAADIPLRSSPVRMLEPRVIPMTPGAGLIEALMDVAVPAIRSSTIPTFEDLALDSGLVLYEADVLLPNRAVDLTFEGVADRALVFLDGEELGTISGSGTLSAPGTGATARLTVIVENLGRVNYGPALGARKGILGAVLVERRLVQRWTARAVPLDSVDPAALAAIGGSDRTTGGAGVSFANVQLNEPLDTHLSLPGYTKGFAWVNGTLLGRYWNIGPQQTLYVPGPLLRAGDNHVVVLELHAAGTSAEFTARPELGPPEQYIEEF